MCRTYQDLEKALVNRIIPLLQEYFYDDWEKIQLVLNDLSDVDDKDQRSKQREDAIVTYGFRGPVQGLRSSRLERRLYEIPTELDAASIRKIYGA